MNHRRETVSFQRYVDGLNYVICPGCSSHISNFGHHGCRTCAWRCASGGRDSNRKLCLIMEGPEHRQSKVLSLSCRQADMWQK